MIPELSARIMRKVFEKSRYRFGHSPEPSFSGKFGIYVHVPFCHSACAFCPFYKELYDPTLKEQYMDALLKEIKATRLAGTAQWMYLGGGTPNTLSIAELGQIIMGFREKIGLTSIGIELLPSIINEAYLVGLENIGFTKISIGVESLGSEVLRMAKRPVVNADRVKWIIENAHMHHLRSNVDMMVGLNGQDEASFFKDIEILARLNPDQVTMYPYMAIRGVPRPDIENDQQFHWIEQAATLLQARGFKRSTAWVLTKDDDLYDSSRDELVQDYAGFGPAAFSTFGKWKVVNPDLGRYLHMHAKSERLGFIGEKTPATEDWRIFASTLYDLRAIFPETLPGYLKSYIATLKVFGYIKQGFLTPKGTRLASYLTKAVVESLPYPLQARASVDNYEDYLAYPAFSKVSMNQDPSAPESLNRETRVINPFDP